MSKEIQALSNEIGKPVPKKKPVINKYLRNFFFKGFKSRKEFKGVQSEIGEILFVTIIISKVKNILRAESKTDKRDIDFTEEEMAKFLKSINVKKSTVESCKSIFVELDFQTQHIHICQNKLDGTTKEFNI